MPAKTLALTPDELLTTTRAVRKRLDFDRPVELSVIRECLEIALQAPSGSNAQGWQFVVVTDPAKRKALADLYKKAWAVYEKMPIAAHHVHAGDPSMKEIQERVVSSAEYLAYNLEKAPAFLIPCLTPRLDGSAGPMTNMMASATMGSLLPAVWSFMLAARARGLGTCWTTLHLFHEQEAAKILGIDHSKVGQCALIPIAYTKGTSFKPAPRRPLDGVLHVNSW